MDDFATWCTNRNNSDLFLEFLKFLDTLRSFEMSNNIQSFQKVGLKNVKLHKNNSVELFESSQYYRSKCKNLVKTVFVVIVYIWVKLQMY